MSNLAARLLKSIDYAITLMEIEGNADKALQYLREAYCHHEAELERIGQAEKADSAYAETEGGTAEFSPYRTAPAHGDGLLPNPWPGLLPDERERLLTREETIAKIHSELDTRLWTTANSDYQLRLFSRYEVEAIKDALNRRPTERGRVSEVTEKMISAGRKVLESSNVRDINDMLCKLYKAMLAEREG